MIMYQGHEASLAAGILSIGSCYCCIQTVSTSYLHRWRIPNRKYKGTILTVVAADGNNQLLPLAIAFAEGENDDSWYWFLERLKQMVVGDVSDVCVIHDRHKGILQAISDIKEGSEERYRAAQWPNMHSRWCMRHMGANFHSQFKNKELTKLFKCLCSTNQEKKFFDLWKKLDDLTKKASE
jgi:hypothetical protein